MANNKMFRWGILLVLTSGSFCTSTSDTSALRTSELKESWQQISEDDSASFKNEDPESTRSASKTPNVDVDIQRDVVPLENLRLVTEESFIRNKRGSGVVIRGPFYPYPRRGHPLRFASGGHDLRSSSSTLLLVVTILLTLPLITAPWRW